MNMCHLSTESSVAASGGVELSGPEQRLVAPFEGAMSHTTHQVIQLALDGVSLVGDLINAGRAGAAPSLRRVAQDEALSDARLSAVQSLLDGRYDSDSWAPDEAKVALLRVCCKLERCAYDSELITDLRRYLERCAEAINSSDEGAIGELSVLRERVRTAVDATITTEMSRMNSAAVQQLAIDPGSTHETTTMTTLSVESALTEQVPTEHLHKGLLQAYGSEAKVHFEASRAYLLEYCSYSDLPSEKHHCVLRVATALKNVSDSIRDSALPSEHTVASLLEAAIEAKRKGVKFVVVDQLIPLGAEVLASIRLGRVVRCNRREGILPYVGGASRDAWSRALGPYIEGGPSVNYLARRFKLWEATPDEAQQRISEMRSEADKQRTVDAAISNAIEQIRSSLEAGTRSGVIHSKTDVMRMPVSGVEVSAVFCGALVAMPMFVLAISSRSFEGTTLLALTILTLGCLSIWSEPANYPGVEKFCRWARGQGLRFHMHCSGEITWDAR